MLLKLEVKSSRAPPRRHGSSDTLGVAGEGCCESTVGTFMGGSDSVCRETNQRPFFLRKLTGSYRFLIRHKGLVHAEWSQPHLSREPIKGRPHKWRLAGPSLKISEAEGRSL